MRYVARFSCTASGSTAIGAPAMRTTNASTSSREETGRGFETIADIIMYRWSAERDVWVSDEEVEQARMYLARLGVTTSPLPDGRYTVNGEVASTLGAARLVLLGLRHLHAQRRSRPRM